jgi:hypothetical protein
MAEEPHRKPYASAKNIDLNSAKVGVGTNQTWLNEIDSDQGNNRKLCKRQENPAMTAMVSVPW